MDFQKYLDNLTNQLKAVNADIVEKQEELDKLNEFRTRIKGGMEVVKQIQSDNAETPVQNDLQKGIRQEVEQMARHGGDLDALWQCTNHHTTGRQGLGVPYNMNVLKENTYVTPKHLDHLWRLVTTPKGIGNQA